MTREEKIEAIYKEMANKELTPGCCVEVNAQNEYGDFTYRLCRGDERPDTEIKEIIGHPVMIGDVLDRYRTNNNDYKVWEIDPYDLKSYSAFQEYDIKRLLNLWTGKRTLINEQPDECIDFVYSLIQK